VVAGISVVTEAPEVPDVPGVTRTSGLCVRAGDGGGSDVSVHAETRISVKSKPAKMTAGVLFFIINDVIIEELI
jgi:hypothetical protein